MPYVLAVANREIAMRTPLRPRVLAAIKANAEGITFRHLIAIPDVSVRQVQKALSQLRNDGKIEVVDGRYLLPVNEATPSPGYSASGFIAPASRERLMAGR